MLLFLRRWSSWFFSERGLGCPTRLASLLQSAKDPQSGGLLKRCVQKNDLDSVPFKWYTPPQSTYQPIFFHPGPFAKWCSFKKNQKPHTPHPKSLQEQAEAPHPPFLPVLLPPNPPHPQTPRPQTPPNRRIKKKTKKKKRFFPVLPVLPVPGVPVPWGWEVVAHHVHPDGLDLRQLPANRLEGLLQQRLSRENRRARAPSLDAEGGLVPARVKRHPTGGPKKRGVKPEERRNIQQMIHHVCFCWT